MTREDIEKAASNLYGIRYFKKDMVDFGGGLVNIVLEEVRKVATIHCCDQCLAPVDEAINNLKIK